MIQPTPTNGKGVPMSRAGYGCEALRSIAAAIAPVVPGRKLGPALLAVAVLTVAAASAATLAAQAPPMPEHPTLREGFLAWDRGDYPEALRAYLEVLNGPEGASHVEEIALLTGEQYRVVEVARDGSGVRVGPDGRIGTFEVVEAGRVATKVVDLAGGAVTATLDGGDAILGPDGSVAYFRVDQTPALAAALQAEDDARRRRDDAAREAARARVELEEAEARRAYLWQDGRSRELDLDGLALFSLHATEGSGGFYALAAQGDDPASVEVYELDGTSAPRLVTTRPGRKSDLIVTETHLVYTMEGALHVRPRAGGGSFAFPSAESPSVGADGSVLAFVREEGDVSRIEAVRLSEARGAAAPATTLVAQSEAPLSNPVVSPDGRWVAYQKMPVDDWEVFAVATDGGGEVQLSLEIQHDRNPRWVGDAHVLAAKGEGRHMRTYVYDLEGGVPAKLFHNNTVRTIAPEYEWAVTPDGTKVLMVSERDGDTVSPERGVYLVDLTARVDGADVRARLQASLAAEEDLRARGRAAFAPVAERVAPITEAVSVARIHEYARDVYAFGSKHITQPGNAMAVEYYAEALRSFGYEPELQWFEPRPGIRSANVIARISGTVDARLVYVASSHFDSVERGPGADDDSSGATALLEVARVLKDHPMPATVELAFFTGEEAGLLGSREYVRRAVDSGKRIVGALNNDMIGWANDHRLDNTIRYSNPGIRDIQHAAAIQFSDLITYDALYYKSTDAAAYYEAYGDIVGGIGSYPVLGNPHYHQATDRLETINQRLVAEVARTTAATLLLLASSPSRIEGLTVSEGMARWTASPESGVEAYEVRWQTDDGWASAEVTGPEARLEALVPGGAVLVRARSERGTVGWDWARANAPA